MFRLWVASQRFSCQQFFSFQWVVSRCLSLLKSKNLHRLPMSTSSCYLRSQFLNTETTSMTKTKFPQTGSRPSFSSDLVRGVYARESDERRSRETRETRAAGSSVSRLQSLAWSFSCLARFAKKKRDYSCFNLKQATSEFPRASVSKRG